MSELVKDGGQKSNNKDLDGVRQIRDWSREEIIITFSTQHATQGMELQSLLTLSHFYGIKKGKGWAFLAFNQMTID